MDTPPPVEPPPAETAFVFLVRHGEAAMPDAHGRYGLNNAALTERGIEQVRRLAAALAGVPVDSLYSSMVPRARQSAAVLGDALGLTPVAVPNLEEIDTGRFEGATLDLLRTRHPDFRPWIECSFFGRFPSDDFHHPADLRFPEGEDVHRMMDRALPAFLDLVRRDLGRVCVFVGHAWLNQALLCHVVGADVGQYYRFAGRNASLNLVEVDRSGRGVLHLLNAGDLLDEVAGGRLARRREAR